MTVFRDESCTKEDDIMLDLIDVELMKKSGRGLGLSIVGRRNGPGVYISDVVNSWTRLWQTSAGRPPAVVVVHDNDFSWTQSGERWSRWSRRKAHAGRSDPQRQRQRLANSFTSTNLIHPSPDDGVFFFHIKHELMCSRNKRLLFWKRPWVKSIWRLAAWKPEPPALSNYCFRPLFFHFIIHPYIDYIESITPSSSLPPPTHPDTPLYRC